MARRLTPEERVARAAARARLSVARARRDCRALMDALDAVRRYTPAMEAARAADLCRDAGERVNVAATPESAALSYGVRCGKCGQYETACACERTLDPAAAR